MLHSPISPLTPDSPLFPDGIMSPLWFSKHQCLLPSAVIAFYSFTMDENNSTLQDNKLKTEINGLKTSISSSTYRFRFVIVLVAEEDGDQPSSAERVGNIRRGTSLDSRSLFLLPNGLSPVELRAFIGTVLASLQPTCIEYYRDLSKHARRKKARGAVPPPTVPPTWGTSQTLSTQGWNVRYEIKLGTFAEFRQEMDAAGHSYEAAYENLVDSDILESVASWSPRFDEARLLADILASRILRCLLWTGQTTSAVQSWNNHRSRMQDLVDRKGKGSSTYGWQAWEARWSSVMAELIYKVDVPIFHVPENLNADDESFEAPDIYAIPEKAFASESHLPPWDLLHHEGYWLWRSARHTKARRKLALGIPKEDRNSPGQSPASTIASRTHLYDTFLCPEPHKEYGLPGKESFDHSALLIDTLGRATYHFSIRQQSRFAERTAFDMSREYMKSGRWEEAMTTLKPLWQNSSWRKAGWWHLLEEASWAVRACARNLGDGETLIAAEWELLSNSFSSRTNWTYNFAGCLEGLDIEETPHAHIDSEALAPCLAASFAFATRAGSVGILLQSQLSLSSRMHDGSAPTTFRELVLFFEGGLQQIRLFHDDTIEPTATDRTGFVEICQVDLTENLDDEDSPREASSPLRELHGRANLTFSPKASKVLAFQSVPREAGEVRASRITLAIHEELFTTEINVPLRERNRPAEWWHKDGSVLSRSQLDFERHCAIEIKPKPPKLRVEMPGLLETYYTDEKIGIRVSLVNEEDDAVEVILSASLTGSGERTPPIHWSSRKVDAGDDSEGTDITNQQHEDYPVGQLQPSETREEGISLQALPQMAEYSLEVRADYTLSADPKTLVSTTIRKNLSFIGPFEANCDFLPRENDDPWPSFFTVSQAELDDKRPSGLVQKWTLAAKVASFGVEPLAVERTTLRIVESTYGAVCTLHQPEGKDPAEIVLQPNELADRVFDMDVQAATLDDTHTSIVSFELDIFWRRTEVAASPSDALPTNSQHSPSSPSLSTTTKPATKTTLLVPSLPVPFGEPRVLASAHPSPARPTTLIHLAYTLENPSLHVLTFRLTLDASDDFAFSGPKSATATLVPRSRATVRYNLLPTRQGVWLRPALKVVDLGFGKVLGVQAAAGCQADRRGLMVWAEAE